MRRGGKGEKGREGGMESYHTSTYFFHFEPCVYYHHHCYHCITLWCTQTVSGLRLVDTFLKRTYEHDELAQVIVFDNDNQDSNTTQQQLQLCAVTQ